jgi:hypothetical protein
LALPIPMPRSAPQRFFYRLVRFNASFPAWLLTLLRAAVGLAA